MAKDKMGGGDAANGMNPRLIPDYELQGRDDSGGPDYDPYTAEFGDGGFCQGQKAHLSVHGGKDDDMASDEVSGAKRFAGYKRSAGSSNASDDAPSSSKSRAKG